MSRRNDCWFVTFITVVVAVQPTERARAWSMDTELANHPTSIVGESADDGLVVLAGTNGDLNGDGHLDLLLGAPYSHGNAADSGTIYLFYGSLVLGQGDNAGLADCQLFGAEEAEWAGFSLDSGDLDGDGIEDLVVGAPGSSCGGSESGLVYVVFGEVGGWGSSYQLSASDASYCGGVDGEHTGYAVSFIGDANGDGRDEIVIGSPDNGDGMYRSGKVHMFLGGDRNTFLHADVDSCDASFLGHQSMVLAGGALSAAGDVNGDGLDDFLVGNSTEGGSWDGWTYLVFGSTSGWFQDTDLSTSDASYIGELPGTDAGNAVAAAGDVNGDGFDDFLIGAPYDTEVDGVAGQVYLILGKASGWATGTSLAAADASFLADYGGDTLGWSVAGVGDVNADGVDDFMFGAPGNGELLSDAGKAYLFFGRISGWAMDTPAADADVSFLGEAVDDRAGWSVAGGSDLDGDGIDDLLIGAPYNDGGAVDAGQVYVVFGTSCTDDDGDGYGSPGDADCPAGSGEDCDDSDASIHPGATEVCNGVDDDCDGGFPTDEFDDDGDGYRVCEADCDDTHPDVNPGMGELCDGFDNDCDGSLPVWDLDLDGDGTSSCAGDCHDGDATLHVDDEDGDGSSPCDGDCDDGDADMHIDDRDGDGYSPCEGDCDDVDEEIHPAAEELCDGIDNDCDGELLADEADEDADGINSCDGDCDDATATVFPGAAEICDGLDNDCDGEIDEVDEDGDGASPVDCGGGDCDDSNPEVHPNQDEECSDQIDNDCDGAVDGQDTDCVPLADDDDDDDADIVGDDDTAEAATPDGCECAQVGGRSWSTAGVICMVALGLFLTARRQRRHPTARRSKGCRESRLRPVAP